MSEMRQLIDAVTVNEAEKRYFRPGRVTDFMAQVEREAATYLGIEDEITRECVAEWVKQHKTLFSRGKRIHIFRVMQLDSAIITNLAAGAELGPHWSYEFDEGNIHGFDVDARGNRGKGHEMFVFQAEIDASDVYFPLTVAYNCFFPHEKEVFLKGVATPKLISICAYSFDRGLDDDNLRPDLIGAIMRV